MEFVDLRDRRDEPLLQQVYDELYLQSFPDPAEREDISVWAPRLWGDQRDGGGSRLHALVAGPNLDEPERRRIAGLAFYELYPESGTGLLSYLAVDPDFRRTGLGRALVALSLDSLRAESASLGQALNAVFAEIHDPERVSSRHDSMDPSERVSFFAKLNARRVPIRYVQPPLKRGGSRARNLDLIVLPTGRDVRRLPSADVEGFLRGLYGDLVEDTDADRDFQRMQQELDGEVVELEPLNAIPEEAAFSISRYGVAFHFVTRGEPRELPPASEQFASFERDLLAYSYRDTPPFASSAIHVPDPCRRVKLQFSRELRFVSEGRTCTLVADDRAPRELRLRASKTQFRSGITVWHLVLRPREGSRSARLGEYDLIKLAKLWEGGEEVRGEFAGHGAESCVRLLGDRDDWTLRELAAAVFGSGFAEQAPRAGILQLMVDEDDRKTWHSVWAGLRKGQAEPGIDVSLPLRSGKQRRLAEGVAGLIQALVDFEEIDDQELRDVYAAFDIGEDGLQGIHKGTLLHIGISDRPFDVAQASFGTSPYLLVPHAVLLHNEEVLEQAAEAGAKAATARGLGELEAALRTMQRSLEQDYVSNVFHYPGEQRIYERGSTSRGLAARQHELHAQLSPLRAKWDEKVNRRRGIADDVRNGLLLVLSYATFRQAFPGVADWILILGLVLLTAAYLAWRWKDRPPSSS